MLLQARTLQLIKATLAGDATFTGFITGGVWLNDVPATATPPYAVISQQATLRDIQGRGGQLVMAKGLITVQVIGNADDLSAKIVPAADRADALLNTLLGTAGGATVIRLVRDRELFYTEPIGSTGVVFAHAGFIYQWWAQ